MKIRSIYPVCPWFLENVVSKFELCRAFFMTHYNLMQCQSQLPRSIELNLWSSTWQKFVSHSLCSFCCYPSGKRLTVRYLVFSGGTLNRRFRVSAHITLHTYKIPSPSLKKKSRLLWPAMIYDSATTHEDKKLIKTSKNVPTYQPRSFLDGWQLGQKWTSS